MRTVRLVLLAFAILAAPAALLLLSSWLSATMSNPSSNVGLVVPPVLILAVGAVLWFVGVIWVIRIFRGPSDEPPPWRYRKR
jgi:hypothetical protein